jgi:hypothetical protein
MGQLAAGKIVSTETGEIVEAVTNWQPVNTQQTEKT